MIIIRKGSWLDATESSTTKSTITTSGLAIPIISAASSQDLLGLFSAECLLVLHTAANSRRNKLVAVWNGAILPHMVVRQLVDDHCSAARKTILVMDNLNTHAPSSLCPAFSPEDAQRLVDTLKIHYTPKHGSWLNVTEIELSLLGRRCPSRRIPDQHSLRPEVAAWEKACNEIGPPIDWRFATADAQAKLKRPHPLFVV